MVNATLENYVTPVEKLGCLDYLGLPTDGIQQISKINDYDGLIAYFKDFGEKATDFKPTIPTLPKKYMNRINKLYLDAIANPNNVGKLVLYGQWLVNPAVDVKTAFKVFSRVLGLNPKEPYSHHHLGQILLDSGLYDQAGLLLNEGLYLEASDKLHEDIHGLLFILGDKQNDDGLMNRHSIDKHNYFECPLRLTG